MMHWIALVLALMPAPPARAEAEGAIAKIVGSFGSEAEEFAGCERSQRKPLVLAAFGGPVRQITFKCQDGAAAVDAYLSYQSRSGEPKKTFLKEAFLRASNPEAEAKLDQIADRVAAGWDDTELAFVKYRDAGAVLELTVSLQGFSWTLLSGATYLEKLKEQRLRQSSVVVSDLISLRLPGAVRQDVALTTFPPGWSLLHLIQDDGSARRVPLRLPAPDNGEVTRLSAFPISADETVIKYQGEAESAFFRIDGATGNLRKLGLTERAIVTKDTETRYALMPSAKAEAGHYAFDLVRVQVTKDAKGGIRSTSERVVGKCTFDVERQDYSCPKL